MLSYEYSILNRVYQGIRIKSKLQKERNQLSVSFIGKLVTTLNKKLVTVDNTRATLYSRQSHNHMFMLLEIKQRVKQVVFKRRQKHRKQEMYLEGPHNRLKYFESINCIPLRMLAWTN
jgi:hypothetical protein